MPTSFAEARAKLADAVRQRVKLDAPSKAYKGTRRSQLLSARRQLEKAGRSTAAIDKELEPVPIPFGLESLYQTFWQVNTGRGEGQHGFLPISYVELKAFSELMDEALTPWEVGTLKAMDMAFLDQFNKTRN